MANTYTVKKEQERSPWRAFCIGVVVSLGLRDYENEFYKLYRLSKNICSNYGGLGRVH